jgi:glycosyltransferase involved in cell wall biosynthesis
VIGTLDAAPASRQLVVTGPYQRDHLADLIEAHRINMILFPSICPETFSYVIEEMMLLRLPIVAFDLGAPGERLRDYDLGRIAPAIDAGAALAAMIDLHHELATREAALA